MKNNMNDPPLCAAGCGFYGNPTQHNLCSKCFRDSVKQATTVVLQVQPPPSTINNNNVTMKKNRCGSCKKRVGLTGFECRCGEVYCGSHRYPEMHSCPFDIKGLQLEALSKTLYSAADCKADKLDYRL